MDRTRTHSAKARTIARKLEIRRKRLETGR